MYKIRFFDTAIQDLQEISAYIALDNPFQAKKVLENIHLSIGYLETFPLLWKEIKYWYRQIVSKNKFKIVYKTEHNTVYIISIFKYKNNF